MKPQPPDLKPSEAARLQEVVRIGSDRAEAAAKTLQSAFSDDPIFNWLLGKSGDKQGDSKTWWDWNMQNLPPFAEVYASGDLLGVAIWLPSKSLSAVLAKDSFRQDPENQKENQKESTREFFSLSKKLFGKRTKLIKRITEHYPSGDWWYLSAIGVDSGHLGGGRGNKILQAKLQHLDEDGLPAYLEASTLKSAALYARHGFKELDPLDFRSELKDVPLLYPMWRDTK